MPSILPSSGAAFIRSHHSLRGVAACLVVILHFRDSLYAFGDRLDAATHFFSRGYLWVDCFFILSGFILSQNYTAPVAGGRPALSTWTRDFYAARLARVYPLHIVALVLLLLVELSPLLFAPGKFSGFVGPNRSLWSFIESLFLVQAWGSSATAAPWNGPSWSVSAEVAAYLLFPFSAVVFARMSAVVRAVVLFGTLCACCAAFFASGLPTVEGVAPVIRCLAAFASGMFISALRRDFAFDPGTRVLSCMQIAVCCLVVLSMHLGSHEGMTLAGFWLLIFLTATDQGLVSRALAVPPLLMLGTLSYSIYMVHMVVYAAYWLYGHELFAVLAANYSAGKIAAVRFLLLLAAVWLAALAAYLLVEAPARQWLRTGLRSRAGRQGPRMAQSHGSGSF